MIFRWRGWVGSTLDITSAGVSSHDFWITADPDEIVGIQRPLVGVGDLLSLSDGCLVFRDLLSLSWDREARWMTPGALSDLIQAVPYWTVPSASRYRRGKLQSRRPG
ncbi:MAG TPA: hypothetical protein VIT42_07910 [Microlunatus sp.]